jgi:DNA-binding IclR family transcriptional regulator
MMLGSAAPWVRRTVGPVAWAVLEVLAERSERDRGRTMSQCSVRGLAGELGLANDTVARAMRRLGDVGLLYHESDREASGRFASGRYVLTLPPDVFDLATDLEQPSLSKPAARPRVRRSSGEQLALLSEG